MGIRVTVYEGFVLSSFSQIYLFFLAKGGLITKKVLVVTTGDF